jgi:cytochrome b561
VLVAIVRHRRGRLPLAPASDFGRAQLLFLIILWIMALGALTQALPRLSTKGLLFVHVSFWLAAAICSLIVLSLPSRASPKTGGLVPPSDPTWRLSRRYWISLCLAPLVLLLIAWLTVLSHDKPLPHSHLRFGAEATDTDSP